MRQEFSVTRAWRDYIETDRGITPCERVARRL
jgi:hypothetical protein